MTRWEPHIHTAGADTRQRPFEGYQDQPDTAERVRLEVQSIPFGLPETPEPRRANDNARPETGTTATARGGGYG